MKVYILLIYLNSTISFTEKNLCTFDKLCSNESGLDLQLLYLPSKPVDTLPFVIVYVFVLIGRNEVKTVLYALFSRSDHGRRLPMSADPIRSERRGAARRGAARRVPKSGTLELEVHLPLFARRKNGGQCMRAGTLSSRGPLITGLIKHWHALRELL